MSVEVVDRHERQAACPRDRLRRLKADEQRTDQPRALCYRDAIDVVERRRGVFERFGFEPSGVRRGYYTDNREDALVMWRDPTDA